MARARAAFGLMRRLAYYAGVVSAWAIVLAFVLPLFQRGIVLSDEGYLLIQALEMTEGKLLYRDLDSFVTPGVWFLLAAVFKLMEPSVLTSRLPALLAYIGLIWVAYRLVSSQAGRVYGLATVLGLMVFTVWAFPTWTLTFYSPFAVVFGLGALERLLAWQRTERSRDLLWMGVMLGLAMIFKQNYGVFALIGCLVGMAAKRFDPAIPGVASLSPLTRDLRPIAIGLAAVGLPLVGYFALHGALIPLLDSVVIRPLSFGQQHYIPYLSFSELWNPDIMGGMDRLAYGATPLFQTLPLNPWITETRIFERLHVLAYWLPPLVFVISLGLLIHSFRAERRVDFAFAAIIAVSGMMFLGVFPRADFNHLGNLYQPVIILTAITVQRCASVLPRPLPLWSRIAGVLGCIVLVLLVLPSVYWYQGMMKTMTAKLAIPRGGVILGPFENAVITHHVRRIQRLTDEGEAVLTLPDFAMLNFLAERPAATRFHQMYEVHVAHDGGQGVVEDSERNGVQLVVARYNDFFSNRRSLAEYAPGLVRYLRNNFEIIFTMVTQDSIYMRRRSSPLIESEKVSALAECDIPEASEERFIRDHLLFSTLYHQMEPKAVAGIVDTRCEVSIPDGGALSLRVGYRHPAAVDPRTILTMFVFVEQEAGGRELVGKETLNIEKVPGLTLPPLEERRIDLSRYSGQRVTLMLRSVFSGGVYPIPFGPKGLIVFWEDLRIESGSASPPNEEVDRSP